MRNGSGRISESSRMPRMTSEELPLNREHIEAYACKFIADHSNATRVTSETLKTAFHNCVKPAPMKLYEAITDRIEEMRIDSILLRAIFNEDLHNAILNKDTDQIKRLTGAAHETRY